MFKDVGRKGTEGAAAPLTFRIPCRTTNAAAIQVPVYEHLRYYRNNNIQICTATKKKKINTFCFENAVRLW